MASVQPITVPVSLELDVDTALVLKPGEVLILRITELTDRDYAVELVDSMRAALNERVGEGRWLVIASAADGNERIELEAVTATAELVARMSRHLDEHNALLSAGHLRRVRIGKLNEELGEVEEFLVELESSNPRKPRALATRYDDLIIGDIVNELLDVATCALGAVEHLTDNRGVAIGRLEKHIAYVADRMGVAK